MAKSLHTKQEKPQILTYFPTKAYGHDGDIVISKIQGRGIFFCVKVNNIWYAQTTMQPLNKIDEIFIKNLKSEKITLNKIKNSEINSDKFLVSSNNNIRYRTGNQIIDDLGLSFLDIDYKTAYCSLQQYSDKETCEANGGTWYYSENDSHDNVSSTAENQLLTVSQSIGNVDAEPTLLYDGSTLNIKYNSDYDDNWQTSAQTNLLKLSYSDSLHTLFNVSSTGSLTVDTVGDIELNADGGDITFKDASVYLANIGSTNTKFFNPGDANDYFKIGVGNRGDTTLSTEDSTDNDAGNITLEPEGSLKFNSKTGILDIFKQGNTDDSARVALGANGDLTITTVDLAAAAAHLTMNIDGEIALNPGGSVTITSAGRTDFFVTGNTDDFARIAIGSNGEMAITTYDAAGSAADLTIAADGATKIQVFDGSEADSFHIDINGATNQMASFYGEVDNYSIFRMYEMGGASTADYFGIYVQEHGATTISTVDGAATAANLTLDVDGDIELNADGGNIVFKDASALMGEFSSAAFTCALKVYPPVGNTNFFKIDVGSSGATEISTTDADGTVGHLTIAPNGILKTEADDGGISIKETADAGTDTAAYGQIWVHDDTPNNLYFTDDAGTDIALTNNGKLASLAQIPYVFEFSGVVRTQYNNWYYASSTTYGTNYYYFTTSTALTSIPTAYFDSFAPPFLVPRDGTVTGYTIIGNNRSTDTWEWICMKGAQPTYGSAGNFSLSQIGATQSAGGTANILYKWEQTGLSVSVSKNDILTFYARRTTDNDSTYAYCEFSAYITMEYDGGNP